MIGINFNAKSIVGNVRNPLVRTAGNIHRAYASKSTDEVRGALRRLPISAAFFLLGFLAITGSPPFGPFVSELSILSGAFETSRYLESAIFLACLLVVFMGMAKTVLKVVQGRPPVEAISPGATPAPYRDGLLTVLPLVGLAALVILLGLFIPAPLADLLNESVAYLGARP